MSTMTRVRLSESRWNVTTPLCDIPLVVFHAIRSFSRFSVMRPSHWRLLNQIFSCHCTRSLPLLSTLSTRCMNLGYWSNSSHASYARSTGTATSVHRWIGRRRVFFPPPPPPPPPPSAFDIALPTIPPPPLMPFFAPSAARRPRFSAWSSPFSSAEEVTLRSKLGPADAASAPTALTAAGINISLLFSAESAPFPAPPESWSPSSPPSRASSSSFAIATPRLVPFSPNQPADRFDRFRRGSPLFEHNRPMSRPRNTEGRLAGLFAGRHGRNRAAPRKGYGRNARSSGTIEVGVSKIAPAP